jgi:anti-repressor protein
MEIMTIANDKIEISSIEIATLTNKEHRNVCRDIEVALEEDALRFEHIYYDSMNRKQRCYVLPKNIAIGIVSGYSFNLRMKIINRLDELENEKNKPMTIEQLLEHNVKVIGQLKDKVIHLEDKITHDKPLVSFAESVKATINSLLIRDWAKSIGIKEKDVRQWLNAKGYIYKQHGEWRMYASDNGYFEQIPSTFSTPFGGKVKQTVRITGKGQTALTEKIKKDLL